MNRWLIVLAMLALSGCGLFGNQRHDPPPPVVSVFCAAGQEMTASEPQPDRPQGEYTQKDVAGYLASLHEWARRGWTKLEAVAEWTDGCIERAGKRGELEPKEKAEE